MKYYSHRAAPNSMRVSFQEGAKGFSLVETLVAITILLVAIVAPMTIIAKGMQTAFYAREQVTSFYLAQEGIELAFKYRDEDALDGSGGTWNWIDNMNSVLSGDCTSGSGCTYPIVSIDGETFPTNYSRIIRITETGTREALISVTVSWSSGLFGGTREVELQTVIMNQYDWLN